MSWNLKKSPVYVTSYDNISGESEDEASTNTSQYSPRKDIDSSDSNTSDDSDSNSDSEPDNVIMSQNSNHDDECDSDVELIFKITNLIGGSITSKTIRLGDIIKYWLKSTVL